MKLIKLKLKNFKGIKNFTFLPQGGNCRIFGDNATGKTTLIDAYCWCLFGKDSLGQANFDLKPIGMKQEAATVEHEAEVLLDGTLFRKVLTEKWTKKRGSADRVFTGHEINHFVNGVPVRKGEYDARIDTICNEQTFRLLTSPRHFSEELHWQKRREILLDVCGDISDNDVIQSEKSLEPLPAILGPHSIDDYRKIILARRTEVNREIEQIPVRVSEVQTSLLSTSEIDEPAEKHRLNDLNNDWVRVNEELVRLETGGEIAALVKEQNMIDAKIVKLLTRDNETRHDFLKKKATEVQEIRDEVQALRNLLADTENQIVKNTDSIQAGKEKLDKLRKQWADTSQLEYRGSDVCPACGQGLPLDKIESAMEAYNEAKSKTLEEINRKGKELAAAIRVLVEANEKLQSELANVRQSIDEKSPLLLTMSDEYRDLRSQEGPANPEIMAGREAILKIEERILELNQDIRPAIEAKRAQLADLTSQITARQEILASLAMRDAAEKRIKALQAEERRFAKEYETIQRDLYLCDLFLKQKVALLTDRINSRFSFTRFKLFHEYISDGISPCCEVSVDGVPYSSLNNAMRIQSGLDVIRTLQQHYGVTLPIWCDNAEAVTSYPEMPNQMIWLYVSEGDVELRIRTDQQPTEQKEE